MFHGQCVKRKKVDGRVVDDVAGIRSFLWRAAECFVFPASYRRHSVGESPSIRYGQFSPCLSWNSLMLSQPSLVSKSGCPVILWEDRGVLRKNVKCPLNHTSRVSARYHPNIRRTYVPHKQQPLCRRISVRRKNYVVILRNIPWNCNTTLVRTSSRNPGVGRTCICASSCHRRRQHAGDQDSCRHRGLQCSLTCQSPYRNHTIPTIPRPDG